MKHILLATDGSSGADRAADVAAELAMATGAKLSIVTVGDNISGEEIDRLAHAEGSVADAIDTICNTILQQAKDRVRKAGLLSDVVVQAGWGDPAEVLIDTARQSHADAIVMGRRGRGRLTGLLLGSVSQKVASLAPCVVIVVP
jgi:nucleotide-binding universal stress UspA family protein